MINYFDCIFCNIFDRITTRVLINVYDYFETI